MYIENQGKPNEHIYHQVKIIFPRELFDLPKSRNENLYKHSFILATISVLLNDTEYPLGSGNVIYSQTTHMLRVRSSMERLNLESYVLPNRKEFVNFMKESFLPSFRRASRFFIKSWNLETSKYETWQLFNQQKYVSDFLNENTPYRGLLLYHGLGSGKSGASIATSEGFHNRKIIILLPASLSTNYKMEIEKFADIGFKRQHNWCYVPLDIKWTKDSQNLAHNEPIIQLLVEKGIPRELLDYRAQSKNTTVRTEKGLLRTMKTPNLYTIIRKKKVTKKVQLKDGRTTNKQYNYGIWLINMNASEPNFDQLSEQDKLEVNDTTIKMTNHRFKIISYNNRQGLFTRGKNGIFELYSKEQYEWIQKKAFNGKLKDFRQLDVKSKSAMLNVIYDPVNNIQNPFDNAVIIVDEIHNLISEMVGSGYNGPNLYEMLMRARNCKFIGLSGTPVINTVLELFLLFNLIRGVQESYNFKVYDKVGVQLKSNDAKLLEILKRIPELDRIIQNKDESISLTRLPYQFIREYDSGESTWNGKVTKLNQPNAYYQQLHDALKNPSYSKSKSYVPHLDITNNVFMDYIGDILKTNGYELDKTKVHVKKHTSFPEFLLKSYEEMKADRLEDGINRLLRTSKHIKAGEEIRQYLLDTYVDPVTSDVKEVYSFLTRILGLVSFYCETAAVVPEKTYKYENKEETFTDIAKFPTVQLDNPVEIEISEYQLYHYTEMRLKEIKLEKIGKNKSKKKTPDTKSPQLFKVFSRQASTFVFPPEIPRPRIKKKQKHGDGGSKKSDGDKDDSDDEDEKEEYFEEMVLDEFQDQPALATASASEAITPAQQYQMDIENALAKIKPENLRPRISAEQEHITLSELGPRYVKMLEIISGSPGLVFGYSQFRKIEGVELFQRVLEADGWGNFNKLLEKTEEEIDALEIEPGHKCIIHLGKNIIITSKCTDIITTKEGGAQYLFENLPKDFENAMQYHLRDWNTPAVLLQQLNKTLVETCKQKSTQKTFPAFMDGLSKVAFIKENLSRARFGLWTGLENMDERKKVQLRFNAMSNMYGHYCKILMTTSAGAEGISLRNVRQVHIMEPYWNRVRVDQVIGRARRVDSHLSLVPEQHSVQVFEYVTKFNEQVKKNRMEETAPELFKTLIDKNNNFMKVSGTPEEGEDGGEGEGEGEDATSPGSPNLVEIRKKKKKTTELYNAMYNHFRSGLSEVLKEDKLLTSDETLYEIGQRKFAINKAFLQLLRDAAIDCIINFEDNEKGGRQREGIQYKNIECLSNGQFRDEFSPETISNLRNEEDKYSFPLEMLQEELAVTRKKQYHVLKEETGNSYKIPARSYMLFKNQKAPDVSKWRIVKEPVWIVKVLSRGDLLNYYRYFGLDPLFASFVDTSLRQNALLEKHLDDIKVGEYRSHSMDNKTKIKKFNIRAVQWSISELYLMYIIKLEQFIARAWEYLKKKNSVTGSFNTNESNLNLIRTLILLKDKSEFPFLFELNGTPHYYMDFIKDDLFTSLSDPNKKHMLLDYLTQEVTILKLLYLKYRLALKQTQKKLAIGKATTISKLTIPPRSRTRRKRGAD
jgi:hypothetical protein